MPVCAAYLALLNRKIQHADHVLMRRARFIQRLHLFQGWPLQEIAFFAYYMREYEVKKGEIIYTAGDVARSVYFVLSGAVALETNKVVSKNSGSTIKTVLEHVRAPRWFGEEELLASLYGDSMDAEIVPTPVRVCVRWQWRALCLPPLAVFPRDDTQVADEHTSTLRDGDTSMSVHGRFYTAEAVEDCHIARMPLSVFYNMKLSKLAQAAYHSTDYLKEFTCRRFEWHRVRREHDPSGFDKDVSYFFIEEVQDEFIPQVLVDVPVEWGNLKRVANRGDQDTLKPLELNEDGHATPAGAAAGAGAGAGAGSAPSSPVSTPRSGGAPRKGSTGSPRLPLVGLHTPRSPALSSPGLLSSKGSVSGDDWNKPPEPEKPDARVLLQRKAFSMMMAIIRCVSVFGRGARCGRVCD